jgi:glucans biosynthesis protein
MLEMTYDQWRDIRFRTDHSLWRKDRSPFEVQFFHLGLYYPRPVTVNVVDGEEVKHLTFSTDQFDYGKNTFAGMIPRDIGYAGFRLHFPIKSRDYKDEVIVFLGASYFRALGAKEIYGLSARGLAVDTVEPSGEEFPYFTEFWLVRPERDAKEMTLYALLDSRRVSGAYRFVVKPGEQTRVDVEGRLYFRDKVKKLGLAPLTSMFFHGENTDRWFSDFRPEVHDSDGLLLFSSQGEWLWRPLQNPMHLSVSAFQMQSPRGFGLVQRDRDFEHYQDLESRSELRPSAWQVLHGDWGEGQVELIELPTDTDINDNVVAFWSPARIPQAGESLSFAYTIYWYGDDASRPPGGRAIATRQDRVATGARRFVVDFSGEKLRKLPADRPVQAIITIASGPESGTLLEQQVLKNPVNDTWRLTFQVKPAGDRPLELRAFLLDGTDTLTETWASVVLP